MILSFLLISLLAITRGTRTHGSDQISSGYEELKEQAIDLIQNIENNEVDNQNTYEKVPSYLENEQINNLIGETNMEELEYNEQYTSFDTISSSQNLSQEPHEPKYTTDYPQKYETFAAEKDFHQPDYKPTLKPYYHEYQVYTTTYIPTTTTYYTTSTTTYTTTMTYTTTTTTYTTTTTTTTYTTSTTTTTYTATTTTTTTAREYKPEYHDKQPEISPADPLNIPHYKTYMKPYYMTTQPPKPIIPYVPYIKPYLPSAPSMSPLPILPYNRYESKHDPVIPYRESHGKTDAPNIPYYNYYKTYPTTKTTTYTTAYTTATIYSTPSTTYSTPITTYSTPTTTYTTPSTTYTTPTTTYTTPTTTYTTPSTTYTTTPTTYKTTAYKPLSPYVPEIIKNDYQYKNTNNFEDINPDNNSQRIHERKASDETKNLALNQVINPKTKEDIGHNLEKPLDNEDIFPMKPLQDLEITNVSNLINPENPKYPEGPIAPPRKPVWSGELVYKDPLKEQEEKSSK